VPGARKCQFAVLGQAADVVGVSVAEYDHVDVVSREPGVGERVEQVACRLDLVER
jgi:hypothetical protein